MLAPASAVALHGPGQVLVPAARSAGPPRPAARLRRGVAGGGPPPARFSYMSGSNERWPKGYDLGSAVRTILFSFTPRFLRFWKV